MNFSPKNLLVQNTPAAYRAFGNWMLLIGLIGSGLLTYHVENPATYFPPLLVTICGVLTLVGYIGKIISGFFGVTNSDELQKLVDSLNKKLNDKSDDSVATNPLKIVPPPTPPVN